MRKAKVDSQDVQTKLSPALDPTSRENQMINYAVNLAEKQLREGTASSQVITHYLKLGTQKEKMELEKMELEKQLLQAKTEALQANKRADETYVEVLKALQIYSGKAKREDFDEEEDW